MRKKTWLLVLGGGLAVGLAMQLVQPRQTNPPSERGMHLFVAAKPSPRIQAILSRSCNDCHSNDTVWPWYSRIAPGSWLISRDVAKGRARLNLSTWGRLDEQTAGHRWNDVCDEVQAKKMPPRAYLWLHPAAKLSADDIDALCAF